MPRAGRSERDVEIFVAVQALSKLTYAEAIPDQSVHHWTMAHRRAFAYFGGKQAFATVPGMIRHPRTMTDRASARSAPAP